MWLPHTAKLHLSLDQHIKLEMCPEDMDAPASEMLEVGNFSTAQWKFLYPCHVNTNNCQLLLHMHWNFMKFGQYSVKANPSLYAQLHTKASTVTKFRECLSSGEGGVEQEDGRADRWTYGWMDRGKT